MPISVRKATLDDLDWVMPELRAFSKFQERKRPLFESEEASREIIATMIEHQFMQIAVRDDGERLGFVGAAFSPSHFLSPKQTSAVEVFWWVSERYRGTPQGSRAALMLFDAFDEWGRTNANNVVMTLEHNSPVSDRFLIKRGYKLMERVYLKEVS